MASRLRAFDWDRHPLGPPEAWPLELKFLLGVCLQSSVPTAIYWGPELRLIYNDAWSPIHADRHPHLIGRPAREVWDDIWDVVGPQFQTVIETGRGFSTFDQLLAMRRGGGTEDTYWTYSFTPIPGPDGRVLGVLNQGEETTERVVFSRNQAFLLQLGDRLRELTEEDLDGAAVLSTVLGALGRHLRLARAGYAALDDDCAFCTILGNWREDRVRDISAGRFRLSDYGEAVAGDLPAGRIAISEDVANDPRHSPDMVASFGSIDVRAVLAAPVLRAGRAVAFVFLNDDSPRRWMPHEVDLARDVADRIWTALDRADATARLRASERRFSAIFGQAAVGLSEVDRNGRFIRFNESMGRILGRDPRDAPNLTVAEVTHPDDMADTRLHLADGGRTTEAQELEKRYVQPDGTPVWAVTHVTSLVDETGEPGGFFSVTTDVSERKEQERIRAWLLAELNHRVKNNLSTVQAIAHHTLASVRNPDEFERVFNARLMALSRAHDLLMRETWTSAALGDLVSHTLAPFALDDSDRIVIGGPEVRLSPTAAVTMTLAFHELATNAAKFGSLSRPEGRVVVAWSIDTSRNGGAVDLEWREADGPIVMPPTRRGFGSRLIERGAARELGGRVRLDFEPEGVACAFHLPLSQKITVP